MLAALITLFRGKSEFETRHLVRAFSDYADYSATTPRFIPRLRRLLRWFDLPAECLATR